MAEFGKLNFQVAFNPTTAFVLDARCYFEGDTALEDAKAAAATAEEVGSKNTVYHYGMKLLVNQNGVYKWYEITTSKTLKEESNGGSGVSYNIGNGLKLDETTNTLSVNSTSEVAEDNTQPITSAGVFKEIGNINALLETI